MSWLSTRAALDTSWYRLINFVGARILQAKELDDFQGTIVHKAHNTVSALFNEGGLMNVKATVNGLSVALEPIDASKPMLCFMAGGFEQISPITLTFPSGKASGTDYIFLNYVVWRVTADGTYNSRPGCLADPNLIDIATNEPVSERGQLQYVISLDDEGANLCTLKKRFGDLGTSGVRDDFSRVSGAPYNAGMWELAEALTITASERMILEAVAGSAEMPEAVRRRACIILHAAEGLANHAIAKKVGVGRPAVLYWRGRFGERGIRGLWEEKNTGSWPAVDPEIERRVVWDSLYTLPGDALWKREAAIGPWDAQLRWTVRNLAQKHGISPMTVQRIWKRHGIKFVIPRQGRPPRGIDIGKLKLSDDPLFGVTVSEIAGVFYDNLGSVVAFATTDRPLAWNSRPIKTG